MKSQLSQILIVDDEANVLTALRRMLHREPYQVHTANTAEEALEMLREKEVSLIISDYRMPSMNGVTFLQQAKELQPDSVRIILSGFADIGAIIDAVNRGEIFKFIAKPWNDDELKMTISLSLEHWQLLKRNKELSGELLSKNQELQLLNDNLEAEIARRSRDLFLKDRRYLLSQFIVEHTPVALFGIDESGMIALANRNTETVIGKPAGAIIGTRFQDAFEPEIAELIRKLMMRNEAGIREIESHCRTFVLHFVPIKMVSLAGSYLLAFLEAAPQPAQDSIKPEDLVKERNHEK
jgi:FixJ family two-component response regulator